MRQLVMTTGERFDINAIRPKIETIVAAFDLYLSDSPYKYGRTMHALMGPVPMILDGARVRKESAATLVGRAVRAHEMHPHARGYVSPAALEALEKATGELLALCETVPVTAVTKVTERIRYSIYYERRKKAIEERAKTQGRFIAFLKLKYPSDPALAQAWNEPGLLLDKAPYPSKANMDKATGNRKSDIEEFRNLPNEEPVIIEEEEENV